MNAKRLAAGLAIAAYLASGFLFTGCATKRVKAPAMSAPVNTISAPVASAKSSVKAARETAAKIAAKNPVVALDGLWMEMTRQLEEANAQLTASEMAIASYTAEVAKQSDALNTAITEKNDAVEKAQYWQAKQGKALRELWFWRGLAITITAITVACVAAWIAWRIYKPL